MSTTWRENYSFQRIFKGRRERTGPRKGAGLYRPLNPSSGQTDFRVTGRKYQAKKKEREEKGNYRLIYRRRQGINNKRY